MSDQDENETLAPVFGVLAGVILGVIALVAGIGIWKVNQAGESAKPAIVAKSGETDIAPVGDALAKLYFAVGKAELEENDKVIVAKALEGLAANQHAIVLLSGFHDASGDAARNAELAKQRALSVKDALVAAGVAQERIKLRKPESTLGNGSAEEGRRVEIRIQ